MQTFKILLFLLYAFLIVGCHSKKEQAISQSKLQQAVFNGTIEDIKSCLKRGASLNKPIGCGDFLPLEGAIVMKNIEKFKFMLQKGARPNKRCMTIAEKQADQIYFDLLIGKKILDSPN